MSILTIVFTLLQAAGAVVGAGGSVFAEIFYLRAVQDGRIDEAEHAHLRVVAEALRWGMLLVLIASVGLVVTNFVYGAPTQPALTSQYWILMTISFAIIIASWGISRRRLSFVMGSAAVFSGWWLILFLVFGKLPAMGFGEAVILYVIATAIFAFVLAYARMMITKTA